VKVWGGFNAELVIVLDEGLKAELEQSILVHIAKDVHTRAKIDHLDKVGPSFREGILY
jgi:hypothetical protein